MNTHKDARRILISVPHKEGEIKMIIAQKNCSLGNHYHLIKTERFTLMEGGGTIELDGEKGMIYPGVTFNVKPGTRHAFTLKKDSILFCICSHPYDPTDDYEY